MALLTRESVQNMKEAELSGASAKYDILLRRRKRSRQLER
jgi:hypothetical protein